MTHQRVPPPPTWTVPLLTMPHDTPEVEIKLTGQGPWALHPDGSVTAAPAPSTSSGYDAAADAASDVTMVLTPGHTRGHVCLYHSPTKVLGPSCRRRATHS